MSELPIEHPAFSTQRKGPRGRDLPPEIVATPMDVLGTYDPATPFWLPDAAQSARLLGWRWLVVIAIAAGAVLLVWILLHGRFFVLSLAGVVIKLGALVVASAISMWAYMRKSATQFRRDPFCIHCGYSLEGLADGGICPECGRPFSLIVCKEYKRDPHWFIERYRKRGMRTPPQGVALEAGTVRNPWSDGTG